MSDYGRIGRIVRVTSGLLAALLVPIAIFLALGDLRRYWDSALATLTVAAVLIYVAIRPQSLPFLDDPAVPDDV